MLHLLSLSFLQKTYTQGHACAHTCLYAKMKAHIYLGFRHLEKAFGLSKATVSEVMSMLWFPVDYRPHVSMSQQTNSPESDQATFLSA